MDILLEQIKRVNKPQVYLTFLETLCGDLPGNLSGLSRGAAAPRLFETPECLKPILLR